LKKANVLEQLTTLTRQAPRPEGDQARPHRQRESKGNEGGDQDPDRCRDDIDDLGDGLDQLAFALMGAAHCCRRLFVSRRMWRRREDRAHSCEWRCREPSATATFAATAFAAASASRASATAGTGASATAARGTGGGFRA
jgi:hypothetical protein